MNEEMSPQELIAEVLRLGKVATQGPWITPHCSRPDCKCDCGYVFTDPDCLTVAEVHGRRQGRPPSEVEDELSAGKRAANGAFITFTRTAAPKLAAIAQNALERLERIDAYAGERCEASGCRPDPCGPVEYHDVEGVPLCAECWQECLDEAAENDD